MADQFIEYKNNFIQPKILGQDYQQQYFDPSAINTSNHAKLRTLRQPGFINTLNTQSIQQINANDLTSIIKSELTKQQPIINQNQTQKFHINDDQPYEILDQNEKIFEQPISQAYISEKKTRVNIDSRDRIINPIHQFDNPIFSLSSNPVSLITDSNQLIFYQQSHPFVTNDKIIIQNVISSIVVLQYPLFMSANNQYVRITHPNHGLVEGIDKYNDILINISGVIGNSYNETFINNIPVNLINQTYKIYLKINDYDTVNIDYYFIKLPLVPNESFTDTINTNVTIQFLNLGGIPLNYINSNYPTNVNQLFGYQFISNIIDSDHFAIDINTNASITLSNGGGNNIIIRKILNTVEGYSNPNDYIIKLPKSLSNVREMNLIGLEFPYSELLIKNFPADKQNNVLYWQILEDGDITYTINITPGNYTPLEFATEIQNEIELIARQNTLIQQGTINDHINKKIIYDQYHIANITIDTKTSIVTFKLYQKVTIENCIELQIDTSTDGYQLIKINHYLHSLFAGDTIIIANAISTNSIPAEILNTTHTIYEVLDENNYLIELPNYNLLSDTSVSNGGVETTITIPIKFRLFFDADDTFGTILGFRDVGNDFAITNYGYEISNNEAYANQPTIDSSGNATTYTNNLLNFKGESYVILTCPLIKNSLNSRINIPNSFVKILLKGTEGDIIYDKFTVLEYQFDDIIPLLEELHFTFYSANGTLYDFNGREHSFTLEFIEDITRPVGTRISTRTGVIKGTKIT